MRYTFLLLFGLMFLGLNTMNAQSCCSKAKASTAAASVSEKKCDMQKASASTAAANCHEMASTASTTQVASGVALFVSGGLTTKACDPSTCDLSKCDLSKCDPSKCDPSKCPKIASMKASTAKAAVKTTSLATSL